MMHEEVISEKTAWKRQWGDNFICYYSELTWIILSPSLIRPSFAAMLFGSILKKGGHELQIRGIADWHFMKSWSESVHIPHWCRSQPRPHHQSCNRWSDPACLGHSLYTNPLPAERNAQIIKHTWFVIHLNLYKRNKHSVSLSVLMRYWTEKYPISMVFSFWTPWI